MTQFPNPGINGLTVLHFTSLDVGLHVFKHAFHQEFKYDYTLTYIVLFLCFLYVKFYALILAHEEDFYFGFAIYHVIRLSRAPASVIRQKKGLCF